ncbi:4'-phosphopantetheinyl transferase superfamily protein [Paenibacillus sp. BR2-3]|uniref:4'-phosphopantetheinyl transferase family protein n=1 Tax=Paenibacillus sp. BR2-3 TaxID=3048494 RepID=UPI003977B594
MGKRIGAPDMLYTTFASRNEAFFSKAVRRRTIRLNGPDEAYDLNLCVASIHQEAAPLEFLSPSETDKYFSFKYQRRRNSYLLGKLAAKLAIASEEDDLDHIIIEHGILCQPIVAGSDRKITITHSDSIGAAVYYDPRLLIGIDIEVVDQKTEDALKKVTSQDEEALINQSDADYGAMLTMLWTIKEAMSKVIQTGFTVAPDMFEISEIARKEAGFISQFKNFPQFQAISILSHEYVLTVVLPRKAMADAGEYRLTQILQELLQPF